MAPFIVKTCKICDKIFQSLSMDVCTDCLRDIDEQFVRIRDYIYDHPGRHSAKSLAEELEIPEIIILELIREERLVLEGASGAPGIPGCRSCGKAVREGAEFCDDCKNELARKLSGTLPKPQKPERTEKGRAAPKMHIDHKK